MTIDETTTLNQLATERMKLGVTRITLQIGPAVMGMCGVTCVCYAENDGQTIGFGETEAEAINAALEKRREQLARALEGS